MSSLWKWLLLVLVAGCFRSNGSVPDAAAPDAATVTDTVSSDASRVADAERVDAASASDAWPASDALPVPDVSSPDVRSDTGAAGVEARLGEVLEELYLAGEPYYLACNLDVGRFSPEGIRCLANYLANDDLSGVLAWFEAFTDWTTALTECVQRNGCDIAHNGCEEPIPVAPPLWNDALRSCR